MIMSRRGNRVQCPSVLILLSLQSGEKLDKIELAFRKFDKNQDGFLSKEEFDVVSFLPRIRVLAGVGESMCSGEKIAPRVAAYGSLQNTGKWKPCLVFWREQPRNAVKFTPHRGTA